jgi:hypothetical protein
LKRRGWALNWKQDGGFPPPADHLDRRCHRTPLQSALS